MKSIQSSNPPLSGLQPQESHSEPAAGRWQLATSARSFFSTLHYLLAAPLGTRTTKTTEITLKTFTGRANNGYLAGFMSSILGLSAQMYAMGCEMTKSCLPSLTTRAATSLTVLTPLLACYMAGRMGFQTGQAANKLLADRNISQAPQTPAGFLKRNALPIACASLGALSSAGFMLTAGYFALGAGAFSQAVSIVTGVNTISYAAQGFVSAHLENRAQSLQTNIG
ncbi:hypothetical protein M3P05_03765 [Sansalvadorimonas sp. 2012CJ34-2]|uniref:Uncharacterized protein n=1 Tax=Parendozoicomonas callyspongiae TaxID=2942213 RepID=A0ABT0PCE1_9GAMM|nr:hypothetical protein [Sansalvadorimonas sp. 2012CJ34-2]MCL6269058.1 hypothetical protein [Sansalvadorimonas sp. 2012CJ34-2]